MVFVADTISRELARIVEFLNEQMKAEVRAVELSWFESEGGVTALTPRTIGETERAQTEKAVRGAMPSIGPEAWIEEYLSKYGPATVEGAEAYVTLIESGGGRAVVASTQGSIVAIYDSPNGALYPLMLSRSSKAAVQLCLGYLISRPAFADTEVRQALYDRLTSIVGPLSTRTLNGYPGFPVAKLNNSAVRAGVAQLLQDIRAKSGAS